MTDGVGGAESKGSSSGSDTAREASDRAGTDHSSTSRGSTDRTSTDRHSADRRTTSRTASDRASAVEAAGRAVREGLAGARARDAGLAAAGPTLQAAADRIDARPAVETVTPARATSIPEAAPALATRGTIPEVTLAQAAEPPPAAAQAPAAINAMTSVVQSGLLNALSPTGLTGTISPASHAISGPAMAALDARYAQAQAPSVLDSLRSAITPDNLARGLGRAAARAAAAVAIVTPTNRADPTHLALGQDLRATMPHDSPYGTIEARREGVWTDTGVAATLTPDGVALNRAALDRALGGIPVALDRALTPLEGFSTLTEAERRLGDLPGFTEDPGPALGPETVPADRLEIPNHTGAPPVAIDAPTILADPIPELVAPDYVTMAPPPGFKGDWGSLTDAERRFAEREIAAGREVESVPRGPTRTPDFRIDGRPVELKTLTDIRNPNANTLSAAISRRALDARGQSGNVVIDGSNVPELTREIAERGIGRAFGRDFIFRGFESIRVIGPDFDITEVARY